MKHTLITILFIFQAVLLFSQDHEHVDLLETDTAWTKEIFPFPIGFAPDINYEGIEEARFPPGWGKVESPEFWSYVFVWNIKLDRELGERELEENLELYFDGLMHGVNKDTSIIVPPTTALFLKKDETSFVGKVRVYDAFRKQKLFVLHVHVEKRVCTQTKKTLVLFRFSPQEFDQEIWKKLKQVKLRAEVCDL